MKQIRKYPGILVAFYAAIAGIFLVAWSPTAPDKIVSVGTGNTTTGFQGLLAGNNGTVETYDSNGYACIIGNSHTANAAASVVSGGANTVYAAGVIVSGYNNTVEGATSSDRSFYSAAIGESNQVQTVFGWAIGHQNEVSASRGIAIGSGTAANVVRGTALGCYNEEMEEGDVLVIGNGTGLSSGDRSTALRVTVDGGVILGSAQGDISMGVYE